MPEQSAFIPISEVNPRHSEESRSTLDAPRATQPVGAVLVVGGGIAGMQASLDLAEQGFRVYLVESQSAIGGHMAQLDKTFPTNDCAMCNLSPKLVETGRHLNIEILPDTEVVGVEGEAGNFTVTLRRKPRYVDVTKCIACGECAEVCPIVLPDEFNESVGANGPFAPTRRAAYRLYTQAVPAAYAIEKRGIAPCRDACPAGQRAQGYIALIAQGRYREAFRVIKEDNPFPSVCGRTCHHPCEGHCARALVDEPVGIMSLKRFVVDYALAYGRERPEPAPRTRPEWVAVVGAGPAGLTAAHDLARLGYGVTVYEALPVAGGMMRVGIPAHRLPKGVLQQDIDDILALGVVLKTNTPIRDPLELLKKGYHAVCLATGVSSRDHSLGIEGEDAQGVISAATFLRKINLGEPMTTGSRVAVVGGGITALDAAAVARRLGAEEVYLVLDRPRGELPAYPWEMAAVEAEGIRLLERMTATRILTDRGRVVGVELARTGRGMRVDERGRRRPNIEPGAGLTLAVDTVIGVNGQFSDLSFLDPRFDDLAGDRKTLHTSTPGLFVVGGRQTGASYIIEAVALGHRVARSIHRYLQGERLDQPEPPAPPVAKFTREELARRVLNGELRPTPRIEAALLPREERVTGFREVVLGLTERQARMEAQRCLQCGLCSECLACVYVCGVNAIDHNMVERQEQIRVGAVILAPGFQPYDARLSPEYGYGRYPNVVTALQFERLLSASGPTSGHVRRPSDGARPKKIAFLQCVGSRDRAAGRDYCSAVCCMYAAKEAIMAKEHEPDTEVHVFMMDARAFSKGYEEYYRRARERYGVHYHRCRISALKEDPATRDLEIRYMDSEQSSVISEQSSVISEQSSVISEQSSVISDQSPVDQSPVTTVHCSLFTDHFDLVVLSVGMEISPAVRALGQRLGIELDPLGFCRTGVGDGRRYDPLQTSRPGIYAAGPFREPKDIPESVVDAGGAAAGAAALLAASRGLLAREREYPPERDASGEEPRVGVFVCHCGRNIGGFLDVPGVAEYARSLPGVAHAEDKLYACSQDSIGEITERAKALGLNRVVVAACSPRTHEPLFQDSIRAAGLNPYLFEMANIRNQCSWVHSDDWEAATAKAKDLVRMSVARVREQEPLYTLPVPIERSALVIGGGPAGMTVALTLAEQGFPVHLVEREAELGGNLRHLFYTGDPQALLREMVGRVRANPLISVHLNAELAETSGFVGNFVSRLSNGVEVRHGVTIVATGGKEYRGPEYGYGKDPRILTQQQFEALLAIPNSKLQTPKSKPQTPYFPLLTPHSPLPTPHSVVMIQCVGPVDNFCGRVCCATALKNALRLKALTPGADVTVLYRDIRTYGFHERLYSQARQAGVRFIRYDDAHRPVVSGEWSVASGNHSSLPTPHSPLPTPHSPLPTPHYPLEVRVFEPVLGQDILLCPDLLVLSTPMVPADGARQLASLLKVPVDADGFFLEAHVKLRPVEFASEGMFLAGAAHYPKFLDEALVHAQAAASRAAAVLARRSLAAGGSVAVVDAQKCTACLTCVRICPYSIPKIVANVTGVGNIIGGAYIEPAICQGCGLCAAECPAKAISLMHYREAQMAAKVGALFERIPNSKLQTPNPQVQIPDRGGGYAFEV